MFDGYGHRWVEFIRIFNIHVDIDIGISMRYDLCTKSLSITGIHLNKQRILEQHQLLYPGHPCPEYLKDFICNIDELKIKVQVDKLDLYKEYVKRVVNAQLNESYIAILQQQGQHLLSYNKLPSAPSTSVSASIDTINSDVTFPDSLSKSFNSNSPRSQ